MVNYERWFGRLLYRQLEGKAAVERLGSTPNEGCEPRGVRDKNKNKHPRSEAREHTGLRTHVPAGISLTVARLHSSLAERWRALHGRGFEG
jgi:hypothetical protein